MQRFTTGIYFIILSLSLFAQKSSEALSIDQKPGPNPWTSLEVNNDPSTFQFAIITDRTGGHRPGIFEKGIEKLNLLQPEFVISVGDLIEGYTEDSAVLESEWDEIEGMIQKLEMPFFYVAGNHDLTNPVMGKIWQERLGRTYYHFLYKNVLFLILNSEDQFRGAGRGTISDEQYQYVRKVLRENQQVRHTFVFMHQPLWLQSYAAKWPDIERLLRRREHSVIVGHRHSYLKDQRNNGKYVLLATTGGGSSLGGPEVGQFDHITWITMKPEEPVMANILLDGVHDEDVLNAEKKNVLEKLYRGEAVIVRPPLIKQGQKEAKCEIILNNPLDFPMKVSADLGFGWDLKTGPLTELISLSPGEDRRLDFDMSPRQTGFDPDDRPVSLKLVLHSHAPGVGQIEVPIEFFVKPVLLQPIKTFAEEINIDGSVDDWESLSYQLRSNALSDNEVQFDVGMNEEYLFLAANVIDDTLVVDNSLSFWKQDAFGWHLRLDLGDDITGKCGPTSFRVNPAASDVEQKFYRGEKWPEDLKYVTKSSENGYVVELRIPLNFINPKDIPWQQLRLNFFFEDKDGDHDPVRRYWQPLWRGPDNILGSGIFVKE